MKTRNFTSLPLTIVTLTTLALAAGNSVAQDSTISTTTAASAQPAAVGQAAPQLSYGVSDILQMVQAKVGDSVIINYIQNSGNSYGLNAAQIIYLRQQGVSDAVINAMLNQRPQTAQTANAISQPAASTAPTQSSTDTGSAQTTAVAAQSSATYVPATTSTVYVIPSTPTYYYSYPYPYYYPSYYYYGWPAVSVSFGWGGYWGGYRGGWHGGWHGGGGWHH